MNLDPASTLPTDGTAGTLVGADASSKPGPLATTVPALTKCATAICWTKPVESSTSEPELMNVPGSSNTKLFV